MIPMEQHKHHQEAMLCLLLEFDRVCRLLDIPYILFAGTLLGAVRHQGFIPWDDDLDVMMMRKDYDRFLKEAPKHLDTDRVFLQAEFSEHWPMFFSKLRMQNTTCIERFRPKDPQMHQGIYIDLFPCDDAADSAFGQLIQFAASKVVIAKSLYARGYSTRDMKKKVFMSLCRLLPLSPFLRLVRCGKSNGEMVHSFLGGGKAFEKNLFSRKMLTERIYLQFEGDRFPAPKEYDAVLRRLYGDYHSLPDQQQRKEKIHAVILDLDRSYSEYADDLHDMTFEDYSRSIR